MEWRKVVASMCLLLVTGYTHGRNDVSLHRVLAGQPPASHAQSAHDDPSTMLASANARSRALHSEGNHDWARQKLALEGKLQCRRLDWNKDRDILHAELQLGNTLLPPVASNRIYLSIVLATNNVNQAGQHNRLSFMVKTVFDFAIKYSIGNEIELLLVDYNSNPDEQDLLRQPSFHLPPKNEFNPLLRVITVPEVLHNMITNKMGSATKPSYWEYIAKNVGIRRACGEYIFVTNGDSIPNEGFWKFIGGHHLRPNVVYRTTRMNTGTPVPIQYLNDTSESILSFLVNQEITGSCGPNLLVNIPPNESRIPLVNAVNATQMRTWLDKPFNSNAVVDFGRRPVTGCPGDFILAPRYAWRAMRGHFEVPAPLGIDDWAVPHLVALGLNVHFLPAPALIYHQVHNKAYSASANAAYQGVENLLRWGGGLVSDMLAKRQALVLNDDDWGLGTHHLREEYV